MKFFLFLFGFIISNMSFALSGVMQKKESFYPISDYMVLENPSINTDKKILVQEAFWYACPHCFHLAILLEKWEKEPRNKNIKFEMLPIPQETNESLWTFHAKVFYALEQMKKTKQTHIAIFKAIHEKHKKIYDINSMSEFLLSKFNIKKRALEEVMSSFAVAVKINRARRISKQFDITGVPDLIIDGKYIISPEVAGSYEKMIRIADFLINKVRKERKTIKKAQK